MIDKQGSSSLPEILYSSRGCDVGERLFPSFAWNQIANGALNVARVSHHVINIAIDFWFLPRDHRRMKVKVCMAGLGDVHYADNNAEIRLFGGKTGD